MTIKEKALSYYPTLWDEKRIAMLVKAGQLTRAEYKEITGATYEE